MTPHPQGILIHDGTLQNQRLNSRRKTLTWRALHLPLIYVRASQLTDLSDLRPLKWIPHGEIRAPNTGQVRSDPWPAL